MGDDDDHSPTTRSESKTCELNASLHDICIMSGNSPRWASYRHLPRQQQLQPLCESPHVPCTALDSAGNPNMNTHPRQTVNSERRRAARHSPQSGPHDAAQLPRKVYVKKETKTTNEACAQPRAASSPTKTQGKQQSKESTRISLKQGKQQSVYSTQLSSTTRRAYCRRSITTRKGQTTCAACDPEAHASDAKHQKEMSASRTQPTAKKRCHHKSTKEHKTRTTQPSMLTARQRANHAHAQACCLPRPLPSSCSPSGKLNEMQTLSSPSLVTHWKQHYNRRGTLDSVVIQRTTRLCTRHEDLNQLLVQRTKTVPVKRSKSASDAKNRKSIAPVKTLWTCF